MPDPSLRSLSVVVGMAAEDFTVVVGAGSTVAVDFTGADSAEVGFTVVQDFTVEAGFVEEVSAGVGFTAEADSEAEQGSAVVAGFVAVPAFVAASVVMAFAVMALGVAGVDAVGVGEDGDGVGAGA